MAAAAEWINRRGPGAARLRSVGGDHEPVSAVWAAAVALVSVSTSSGNDGRTSSLAVGRLTPRRVSRSLRQLLQRFFESCCSVFGSAGERAVATLKTGVDLLGHEQLSRRRDHAGRRCRPAPTTESRRRPGLDHPVLERPRHAPGHLGRILGRGVRVRVRVVLGQVPARRAVASSEQPSRVTVTEERRARPFITSSSPTAACQSGHSWRAVKEDSHTPVTCGNHHLSERRDLNPRPLDSS